MYKISHYCISTFVICALLTLLSFQVFADSPDASSDKITVVSFSITPSAVPHRNELVALLADDVGQELTFAELSKLTDRVTRYLRSRGYMVASAYLPAQKAQDGKVEIAVLIGNYDKIILNNNTGVADSVVKKHLASIKTGSIIRKEPLERAVWLLSDLSGVEAKVTLEPGGEVGTSNLIVHLVSRGKSISGSSSFDNYGNKFTGNNEGGMSLSLSNPFNRGDSFFVRSLLGSDLASGIVSWEMPVAAGHKLALSHSKMNYTLGGQFAALGSSGSANVLEPSGVMRFAAPVHQT
jgi:hemolysin activation/secretion protein